MHNQSIIFIPNQKRVVNLKMVKWKAKAKPKRFSLINIANYKTCNRQNCTQKQPAKMKF